MFWHADQITALYLSLRLAVLFVCFTGRLNAILCQKAPLQTLMTLELRMVNKPSAYIE